MSGDGCSGHAELPGSRNTPSRPREWCGPAGDGLGGGAAREAGLRRAPCVDVNVSVLHSSIVCCRRNRRCCRRCRNRRSLQPRASPLPPRTDQCPRVKPHHSLHVAARGHPGTASGRRRATRWKVAGAHRLVRGTATCGSREGRG
ncbi:Pleckstrin-likey Domain-Containing Family H Member 2 [Manis pentadactyla]|nr:Pleckstrin-likey Domain-Containing Family H Member 2 [Manis pentadactyla]